MTLDAERLRGEAERRIEQLQRNAETEDDRQRAVRMARLIRDSLACRLKAAEALAEFERLRARVRQRQGYAAAQPITSDDVRVPSPAPW